MLRLRISSVALATLLLGCGGTPRTTDLSPPSNRETVESMPEWYSTPPNDPNYLFGPATATSQDLQLAVNKAQTEGRNQIAQQLDVRFQGLSKRFQEDVGFGDDSQLLDEFTQVYKAVTSEVITGSRARNEEARAEGDIYRVYVLMEVPIGAANASLLARLRASEHLYTRVRAAEAFEELQKEVEAYEAWKRAQGQKP